MGLATVDDAGVYRLSSDLALVQTVDILTPVVDDPFQFGRIAAANALSDVYAMGARPLTALNIAAFPDGDLDLQVLRKILAGGLETLQEAQCVLVGGHTISDRELKYGLAVTGLVHPERVWKNRGLRPGDRLVLTKALGTGILATALKAGMAGRKAVAAMTDSMARLNEEASRLAQTLDVSACTDVTGFGLVGHAAEMIQGTGLGLEFEAASLPVLPEVEQWSSMGLLPAGLHRNRCHRGGQVEVAEGLPGHLVDVVFDPQTSGGLLVGLPEGQAGDYAAELRQRGHAAAVVARVVQDPEERIRLL